uniref:C-type lectin domain-containing protein n=1 Tax=Anas platyrhynchos TaxID=8839 RepID=A0A8B9SXT2_ANAPL
MAQGQCYVTLNTSATDAENWENGCRESGPWGLAASSGPPVPSDGRGCRLCPRDWLQHGNWCYWVSHESRDWQRSRDDCAQKGSALFIIRNREQMVLQDVTQGRGYVWIGLAVTGAKVPHPLALSPNSGGFLSPPGCNAESRWVCEKDAVTL